MLQTDWILTDTWVPLNGFQDQVLKKFPLYIQELRKDRFYPMLRFVSKGSRRFLLLGSLLPLICSGRVRSTYGPHSGSSEPFRLPSAAPLQLRRIFPQCDDQNCIASPQKLVQGYLPQLQNCSHRLTFCFPVITAGEGRRLFIADTNKSIKQMFRFSDDMKMHCINWACCEGTSLSD